MNTQPMRDVTGGAVEPRDVAMATSTGRVAALVLARQRIADARQALRDGDRDVARAMIESAKEWREAYAVLRAARM